MVVLENKLEDQVNANNMLQHRNEILKYKIYIPHRKCDIDQKLGEFVNNFPERDNLKIMFLRETEGVYKFGQKRVYIKIANGNQILVRVGGGFMSISEFVK